MKSVLASLFAVAIAVALAGVAQAQQGQMGQGGGGPDPGRIIQRMDRDGDGRISRDEFRGPPQRFGSLDANGDGFISRDEFGRAFQRRGGGRAGGSGRADGGRGASTTFPFVDTHVHIQPRAGISGNQWDDWDGATRNALAEMDKYGIRRSIIMSPPQSSDHGGRIDIDNLLKIARAHPDRFAVMGGGSTLNPMIDGAPKSGPIDKGLLHKFERTAEDLLRKGAIGFGEMAALHFSFFKQHPYERTPPDHPLFLLLADIAARHGVPIDLHMEAVVNEWRVSDDLHRRSPNNPDTVPGNIAALERLLAHNRRAKIVWVHVGMDTTEQRSPALTRRLLERYPNFYLNITGKQMSVKKYWLTKKGKGLNPAWRRVIMAFPDRFMIGSDSFYQPDEPFRQMPRFTARALQVTRLLPKNIARKIAYENAERIYNLKGPRSGPVVRVGSAAAAAARARREDDAAPLRVRSDGSAFTEAEIRKRLIGNTIHYTARRGNRTLNVYFAADGSVALQDESEPGRVITKRWFFNEKGLLCRTIGRQNRNHCTKVTPGETPDELVFYNRKVRYKAVLYSGRRLRR